MSKRFLLSIILVLILTNLITLLFWNQNDHKSGSDIVIDQKGEKEITTNKPVATIEGKEISYEDWNKSLQAEYGEMHLKKLVDRSVVDQLAKKRDIQINEKLIDHDIRSEERRVGEEGRR